jgi:hypothetical protein
VLALELNDEPIFAVVLVGRPFNVLVGQPELFASPFDHTFGRIELAARNVYPLL